MDLKAASNDRMDKVVYKRPAIWSFVALALLLHAGLFSALLLLEPFWALAPDEPVFEVEIIAFAPATPQSGANPTEEQKPSNRQGTGKPKQDLDAHQQPVPEPVPEPAPRTIANTPPLGTPGSRKAQKSVTAKASTKASFDAGYLRNPAPRYPIAAYRQRAEGTVIIRAQVLPNGLGTLVQLERSSGHQSLDDAALAAVKKWQFQPATENGKPVRQWVSIPITFRLNKR